MVKRAHSRVCFRFLALAWFLCVFALGQAAWGASDRTALALKADDVLPTGNEWIALPDIRAMDGALGTFNVISMRDRGLLQVAGAAGTPVLQPYFVAEGKPLAIHGPKWELIEYWIPTARQTVDGMEATLTWCAPPGSRAAFLRMTLTNQRGWLRGSCNL